MVLIIMCIAGKIIKESKMLAVIRVIMFLMIIPIISYLGLIENENDYNKRSSGTTRLSIYIVILYILWFIEMLITGV